jgi:Zn-dependent protease with chaperone function
MKRHIVQLAAALAAVACTSSASGQGKLLEKVRELRNLTNSDSPATAAPQTPAAAPPIPTSVSLAQPADARLERTFNVLLGEPPIAIARDNRCENIAPTNPAELVTTVLGQYKEEIIDIFKLRREDRETKTQETNLAANARLELKRHVWLPLAVEEAIGQRILAQRTATVIAEDDPAASDFYPAIKLIFDELRTGAEGLQPYDLELLVIDDATGIPNAETLPGGIVLMNVALAQAEPERIYAYLSHELGHVTKRHHTMALQAKLIDGMQGANALRELGDLSNEQLLDRALEVVDLTAAVFTRYYSAQELEADGCGAKYLAASPIDGPKSIQMFLEDIGELEKAASEPIEATSDLVKEQHPSYAERQNTLNESYRHWAALR